MIEIPRFPINDYLKIKNLLKEASVPFENHTKIMSAWSWGGTHEYFIYVEPEHLNDAVTVIKKYYGIATEQIEMFSGNCPGCGFSVNSSTECPDCGLNLTGDRSPGLTKLPFYDFLVSNNLL